jgi:Flp pilus assembly protein TadD
MKESSQSPAPGTDRLIIGLSLTAILGLFLPFIGVPFEYDDKVEIVANEVLRTPSEFQAMWEYNPFRILLLYTFSADIWAWGILRPEGYRGVNILIHCCNTALVFALLRRLGPGPNGKQAGTETVLFRAAGTLLFAVHPLAIESVTYVSGRSSSLATTFVLASMLFYVRHRAATANRNVGAWFGAEVARANRLVATLLGGAMLAGLPSAWAVHQGSLTETRALLFSLAAGGAALVVMVGIRGRSWLVAEAAPQDADARRQARYAVGAWILAFLFFLAGCLTKEIAAVLPAILLLLEAHWFQDSWRSALRTLRGRLFPFFGIPAALILLRAVTYGYVASPVFIRSPQDNLATQVEVIWNYIRLWLVPYPQSIYHDYPTVAAPGTVITWIAGAALLTLIILALKSREHRPALAFGVLVALGSLAPTSSVFALKESMVEHRTYLPSIGYAFVAAWFFGVLLPRWFKRSQAVALLVGLVLCYGTLHVSYNLLWRSEEVLWSHAVSVNPGASDAWRNLGDLYRAEGRTEDARKAYEGAVRSKPGNIEARTALAVQVAIGGDLNRAETLLRETLTIVPCHGPALNNLAMVKNRRGDWDRAVQLYDQALECDPTNAMAHLGLGHIYFGPLKSRPKAAEHYQQFLDIADPLHPSAAPIKQRLMGLTW